jgi:hypothetical protein
MHKKRDVIPVLQLCIVASAVSHSLSNLLVMHVFVGVLFLLSAASETDVDIVRETRALGRHEEV